MSNNDLGLATEIIIMGIVVFVILLFVGIGLLVFIHACIVGRSFRNNNNSATDQRGSNTGTTSMSKDDLSNLPIFDFVAKSKGSSPVDCAVCLDNFRAGDKCRLLPLCRHSFHAQCVDEWLLKTPICPICRTSADSRRTATVAVGEGSSHFSDSSIDMRGSQTTNYSSHFSDAGIELRDSSNTTESTQATTNDGIELTDIQTNLAGTTHFSSNP